MSPQATQNPSNLQSTYGAFITTICTKNQDQEEGVTTDDPVGFTRNIGLDEEDKYKPQENVLRSPKIAITPSLCEPLSLEPLPHS